MEVQPDKLTSINQILGRHEEVTDLLQQFDSLTIPSNHAGTVAKAEERQSAPFLSGTTTNTVLSRADPTRWFYWHGQFTIAANQRGWNRRGILLGIPIANQGNPGDRAPSPDEKYGEVIQASLTFAHVKGFYDFLQSQRQSKPSVWVNWLHRQRVWMHRSILSCLDDNLKHEVTSSTQIEIREDGPCLLRWLREQLLVSSSQLYNSIQQALTQDSLTEKSTSDEVYQYLTDRQMNFKQLSGYFEVPDLLLNSIKEKLEHNLLRVPEPRFNSYLSTFIREEIVKPQGLTVPALLKRSLELYSQFLSGNQAHVSVKPASPEQTRAMMAQTEPSATLLANQNNHWSADPRLDQLLMAALARVDNKKRKSGYQGRGKGGGGGGKGRTPPNQGGGRGGGSGQTSQTTTGSEHPIPKWKLRNPKFLSPPTDGNVVAFVDELNEYRYWCGHCAKWTTHIGTRCPRLTAETPGAPGANPGNSGRHTNQSTRGGFAGVAHYGPREPIVNNDGAQTDMFEADPGNFKSA
jgi:hypothetical protein